MKIIYPPSSFQGLEILSCSDGHGFSKHLHDGYVLWLNSASGEHFSVKGGNDILEPGCISIIEPGVVHSNRPCDPGRRHLRSFYFSERFLGMLARKISGQDKRLQSLPTAVFRDRPFWGRLAMLHERMLHPSDILKQEEEILSIFAEFCLRYSSLNTPAPCTSDWRIPMISSYLYEHWDEQVSLTTLAHMAQCTEYHVIRLFRQHADISPHAFLTQIRLEKSRRFLDQGQPIAETALASGFCDQSHLTRAFKNRYGVTPGQYLKQRRRR